MTFTAQGNSTLTFDNGLSGEFPVVFVVTMTPPQLDAGGTFTTGPAAGIAGHHRPLLLTFTGTCGPGSDGITAFHSAGIADF
ncbi:hypothetical protein ACWIGW_41295 [Nocardia brasiliensis]